ncbi:TPA: autotransporter, partial [Mannheimia haemolytica]|nr:autotransporter [Mannheimia haemolytica]
VTTNGKNYLNVADNFNTGTNTTNYAVSLTDDAIRDFTKDNDTVTGVVDDGKDYKLKKFHLQKMKIALTK